MFPRRLHRRSCRARAHGKAPRALRSERRDALGVQVSAYGENSRAGLEPLIVAYRCEVRIDGRKRKTQLYRRWCDMRGRARGYGTKCPWLYEGVEIEWPTFAEFRAWALEHGFRKDTSLDRRDPTRGYTADNVRFVSVKRNNGFTRTPGAARCHGYGASMAMTDDELRGSEPPTFAEVCGV